MQAITTRQALLSCLGNFPLRVPLNATVGPTTDEGGYTRTLLIYAVEPDERIAAWLLSPKGPIPAHGWPAILAIHQHAGDYALGKSEPAGLRGDPMFFYGAELCQRGYVVLCPDLLCFEERQANHEASPALRALHDHSYERFEFTKRLLTASCLQTKYLHDLRCALDLLTSLPAVNADRVGVIGHSLGGQEALWLTWYDPRIAVAVSSCGFGLLRTILRDGILHNMAAYVPGMLTCCDLDSLLASLAPRPFLLTAGEADTLFPLDGVQALIATAQQAYAQAGAAERFQAVIFAGPHSFPDNVKQIAYDFLDQWLK